MNKKLKIVIIGGMGDKRFLAKIEPLIVSSKIGKIYLFRYKGNILKNYKNVVTFPLTQKGAFPNGCLPRFIFDIYNFCMLFGLCLLRKIDLIIGLYLYPHGFYASILGNIFKIPFILILPGTDLKMYVEKMKYHKLFLSAKYLGVRGENSMEKLIKLGYHNKQIFILHNVFDFEMYRKLFPTTINKEYDIVFTGFLRKLKRIDLLINVVLILKQNGIRSIKCLIVGDGPMKEELLSVVNKLDLNDNIIFQSYIQPIYSVLLKSKIFVMTSESEGLPMSMIEAMACKLPVVISKINDIPDIIESGKTGYLVEKLDVESFAFYINLLLNDEKLREKIGDNAFNRIETLYETNFSFKAINKEWEKILDSII